MPSLLNKRPGLFIILFIGLFIQAGFSIKATEKILFERFSVHEDSRYNAILCIHQDKLGFIWLGTTNGLQKYDGYRFSTIDIPSTDQEQKENILIYRISEDKRGNLWIGTNLGLFRLELATGTLHLFQIPLKDLEKSKRIRIFSIFQDQDSILWLGTAEGLRSFNLDSSQFVPVEDVDVNLEQLAHIPVYAVHADRAGNMWLGTPEGLFLYSPELETMQHFFHEENNANSLSHDEVLAIAEDAMGTLWIGTSGGGLNRANRDGRTYTFAPYTTDTQPISLLNDTILTLYCAKNGIIWIGTMYGLDKLDPKTNRITHLQQIPGDTRSLSHNLIWSVFEDRSGVLWVGTNDSLNKYAPNRYKFYHHYRNPDIPGTLSHNLVLSIHEDSSGVLWVGTLNGLNRYNEKSQEYIHYTHSPSNPLSLSHNNVRTILEDKSGQLWIGTDGGGLNRFERETGAFFHYRNVPENPHSLSHDHISTIYQDSQGDLWVGTFGGGLNKITSVSTGISFKRYVSQRSDPETISNNMIRCIYEDRMGTIWIGTDGGLNRMERTIQGELFKSFRNEPDNPSSLGQDGVLSIYEDREGRFWIGTWKGGLNLFDRNDETFIRYTEKDGLPDITVYGILEDEAGFLWLSTNKGLSRFDPEKRIFRNFDTWDGLQDDEFNGGAFFKNRDGQMYFGGINGLNFFSPGSLKENVHKPRIVVTDLLIFDEVVPQKKAMPYVEAVKLSSKEKYFGFRFAALDYTVPEKNRFLYRLEGYDKEWKETDFNNPQASYANIPSGKYTLRVKGCNNDGVWNTEGAIIFLTISSPFWKSWFFWGTLLFASLVFGVVWRRKRKSKKTLILPQNADLNRFYARYGLTKREQEIVQLILSGNSNKEIMKDLYISVNTVKTHISNIFQKTGVKSRGKLIDLIRKNVNNK